MKCLFAVLIAIFILIFASASVPVMAGTSKEDPQNLADRIKKLEEELQNLKSQLREQQTHPKEDAERAGGISADEGTSKEMEGLLGKLSGLLEVHATLEVEGSAYRDFEKNEGSDVKLATAKLSFTAKPLDYISGTLVLLYEEDETDPMNIDEGYIIIGNTERFPIYLKAGKHYLAGGEFETKLISDPLTLELAETNKTSLTVGTEYQGFFGAFSLYNGDIEKADHQEDGLDHLDQFAFSGGYKFEVDELKGEFWGGYFRNIADSDTLKDFFDEKTNSIVDDYVGAVVGSLSLEWKGFYALLQYASAVDRFEQTELEYKGRGAKPKAWNLEMGYTMEILGKETTFSVAYQGTDQAVTLFPRERYMGGISIGIFKYTTLSFEYAYDKDYSEGKGGSGEDGYTFTSQLALEF